MTRKRVILFINGERAETTEQYEAMRAKWCLKGNEETDIEAAFLEPSEINGKIEMQSPKKLPRITSTTELYIYARCIPESQSHFFGTIPDRSDELERYSATKDPILNVEKLAHILKKIINTSDIGTVDNPLSINLLASFSGYSPINNKPENSLSGKLLLALLVLGVHAKIIAPESLLQRHLITLQNKTLNQMAHQKHFPRGLPTSIFEWPKAMQEILESVYMLRYRYVMTENGNANFVPAVKYIFENQGVDTNGAPIIQKMRLAQTDPSPTESLKEKIYYIIATHVCAALKEDYVYEGATFHHLEKKAIYKNAMSMLYSIARIPTNDPVLLAFQTSDLISKCNVFTESQTRLTRNNVPFLPSFFGSHINFTSALPRELILAKKAVLEVCKNLPDNCEFPADSEAKLFCETARAASAGPTPF